MKISKAIIFSGLMSCAFISLAGFSSCNKAETSAPFSFAAVKGAGVYVSYTHTKGETSRVVESHITETVYYIEIFAMNTNDGATVNASDISIVADGQEYFSYAFVSFKRGFGEDINGYKTTGIYYDEKTEALTLGRDRTGSVYRAAFYLPSVPDTYSAFYKGEELKLSYGESIATAKYKVADNLFMAAAASSEKETEIKAVQPIDIGPVTTQTEIVDETTINGTYNYVEVQATVGTEDVTVYASEFSLTIDGVSYPSIGFADESFSYTGEDGGISVTEYKVTLYNTYVIGRSDVALFRPAFDADIGDSDFEIYYGGVKLS